MARTKTKRNREPYCVWTHDGREDAWDTGCGQKFQFNDGGPRENGFRFCCYCGACLPMSGRPEPSKEPTR